MVTSKNHLKKFKKFLFLTQKIKNILTIIHLANKQFLSIIVKKIRGKHSLENITPPPEWIKDLIIYEINPYAFTSPEGPASGTFSSLEKKMDYLSDLGINAVWLAGYAKCTKHFFNVKSIYACSMPFELDPELGSEDDFKSMIDEAHNLGIKIFLDVISHGVLQDSPLAKEHPEWFEGGSWGMKDFNYEHPEFREWWIENWTNYVLEYGVDGFRIDLDICDSSVWDEITRRCSEAGKPIVVFVEFGRYHFSQHDKFIFNDNLGKNLKLTTRYDGLQASCHDISFISKPGQHYRLKGRRSRFAYNVIFSYQIPIFMSGEEFDAEKVSLPDLEKFLFGGSGPGGWMYGSWLQWQQLEKAKHYEMLEDVKKMIAIRKDNMDLIHGDKQQTNILPVKADSRLKPVPYARFVRGEKALIVAVNESQKRDIDVRLTIPLNKMGMVSDYFEVEDLWNDKVDIVHKNELTDLKVHIKKDKQKGGGVFLLKIRPKP